MYLFGSCLMSLLMTTVVIYVPFLANAFDFQTIDLMEYAVALALAFEISKKALKPIDFFFLDEGFGTLDEELIDAVTDSLEKLRRADLTVGLITHVAELKNRISSKLNVSGADINHGTIFSQVFD